MKNGKYLGFFARETKNISNVCIHSPESKKKKIKVEPGVVAHALNTSIWQAEEGKPL